MISDEEMKMKRMPLLILLAFALVALSFSSASCQSIDQRSYRWHYNNDLEDPAPREETNKVISNVHPGDILRLRLALNNNGSADWLGGQLKLQYTSSESLWVDVVEADGDGEWRYCNGLTSDKSWVSNLLLSDSDVREHFVESSPTALAQKIPGGSQGEWDICLENKGAPDGKVYRFRLVYSNGTELDSYSVHPRLVTFSTNAMFIIMGVSVGISTISMLLTKKLVYTPDFVKKREMIMEFQREHRDALKKDDKKRLKKLEKKKSQMDKMQAKMSLQSFKTFPLLLPFSIPFWFMAQAYGYLGNFMMLPFPLWFLLGSTTNYFMWYLISSFTLSQLVRKILKM